MKRRPWIPVLSLSAVVVVMLMVAAAMVVGLPAAALAQSPRTEHTLRLDTPDARPPGTLDGLRWLPGSWAGTGLGGNIQEMWTAPTGGSMAGVFKLTVNGAVTLYEMMWIVEEEGTLALRLKHFRADLTGWEDPDEHVDFPLVRMEEDTAYFDGLTYRLLNERCLVIWVALAEDGVYVEEEIRLAREGVPPSRCADPPRDP